MVSLGHNELLYRQAHMFIVHVEGRNAQNNYYLK